MEKSYACIDLKSFYASVECKERGLDPITTNLVVADEARTEKTICLAVSPALKAYGIPGRARLFEVIQKVNQINYERKRKAPNHEFEGESYSDIELKKNPKLKLSYIAAPPRMGYYMKYSADIYNIYLKYLAPEDVFSYSVDEVFCDLTNYLGAYKMSAKELVTKMIQDVYKTTGITATSGIGTNMYLAKIAMDIVAKHEEPNEFGVRIAELNEMSYRKLLWTHKPLTDFWRVGKGYRQKLEEHGLYTMGDIARCSIENEDLLYRLFGVNAEILIDHSWGYEPTTIKQVKEYKPVENSKSSGQVLHRPYNAEETRLIVKEMTDLLILDLVSQKLVTDQIVLTIGYDVKNLENASTCKSYKGEVTIDRYGRNIPKHAHGTINLDHKTSSTKQIMNKTMELFDKIINKAFLVRRINVTFNHLVEESEVKDETKPEQLDLFTDYEAIEKEKEQEKSKEQKERNLQNAVLGIKRKYGKNAVLKGMNFEEGATTIERNAQIGGHKE